MKLPLAYSAYKIRVILFCHITPNLTLVYKDALMLEAELNDISTEREREFKIEYKQIILQHSFFADFVFFNEIIVEVKANKDSINDISISQTLNYLKASGCRVGLIINFGRKSLEHQRLIF